MVELLEPGAVVPDVGHARHRVREDLLFQRQVPVMDARVGLLAREVARRHRPAGEPLSLGQRNGVAAVLAGNDRRDRAQAVVPDPRRG